jgi:arabinan endo-1,5-alpha-L-arabinosidase
MTRLRAALSAVLLLAGLLSVPAIAGAAPATSTVTAPPYHNPLKLMLPDGTTAQSCADPFVLRVPGSKVTSWFLYCTSDPLTDKDCDAQGNCVIHNIPTYQSADLIHWVYKGDAFATKPSWVTGGMWAPDVVHRNGQYYMYFTASSTTINSTGCDPATQGCSAIGVATAPTPAGPWTASDTPVVPPDSAGHWKFDPEVIYVNGTGYLYYGSYYGGIWARTLSADGMSSDPTSETQIAIDNRYEGTFIVRHGGYFYFMGSAANCCNGPLSGYAVFSARSKSPLGPFVDRDGVSILASRVGGTPVLMQNGNRWVGPGHNAVITDYSGQQWIIYHAIPQNDPYFGGQPGINHRPALIDPLDWQSGWPTTRGGRGPSDQVMPGPAAQPWETTAYRPSFVSTPQPGAKITRLSDDFNGSSLSSQWTWVRQPAASTYWVSGGALHWQIQNADLHPESGGPLASVLTEPAPTGDYIVETRYSNNEPANGECCWNYAQGAVLAYKDDGNYIKLDVFSNWNTRQTEFGKEVTPVPTGYPHYGNGVGGPVGDKTWLRIVRHVASGQDYYTAYTSIDGVHWDRAQSWRHDLGPNEKIALVSMGGPGDFISTFDYVHVYRVAR